MGIEMSYKEVGKMIFGDSCPDDWGRDRPWRVERYERPRTKACHHKSTAVRIVTASGIKINFTERIANLIVEIANGAKA